MLADVEATFSEPQPKGTILSAEEFDVVRGHIYFEEELVDEREQALYKSALKKMREVLYV